MKAWLLLGACCLVGCREYTDDRPTIQLSKFTSTPPIEGQPLVLSVDAANVADFQIKQGSKVLDWGVTLQLPYTTTITAVNDEIPVLEAWDYRLEKHTQVAVITGQALGPKPAPIEPEPGPAVPNPEPALMPTASPLDGGMNCSKTSLSRGDISVQNLTQRTLQPVWISYDCQPQWQFHPVLAPGAVFLQSTFGTHVFQFYDVGTFELISELTLPEPLGPFYAATIEEP